MYEDLRIVKDLREDLQRHRVALQLRIYAIDNGRMTASHNARTIFEDYMQDIGKLEKKISRDLKRFRKEYPLFNVLCSVDGISDVLAARLLSEVKNPLRFPTISKLWRYAGYAVINGKRERLVHKEKSHYSTKLKTTCYLISNSFIKRKENPYRKFYEKYKQYYSENRDWNKLHIHLASIRKVSKLFLWHFFQSAYRLEGKPVPLSYIPLDKPINYHSTLTLSEEYGWQGLPPNPMYLFNGQVYDRKSLLEKLSRLIKFD